MRRSHLTSVDDPRFELPRSGIAKPSLQERLRGGMWLAFIAVALVPLVTVAQVQLVYLAVPAVIVLASRWMATLSHWAAIAGVGLLAGLGAAGVSPSSMLFYGFATLALLAAWGDEPRATRTTVVIVGIVTVLLVQRVLVRAGWHDEEESITQLATGCAACLVASFATLTLQRLPPTRTSHLLTLIVGACAALAAGRIVVQKHAITFPRWVTRAQDLTLAPPSPQAADLLQLERLQNAGFRDAGLARAGVLLAHDADPKTLRYACFLGYRAPQLAASWAAQVALGDLVCRAVHAWPETGAAMLERALDNRGDGDGARIAHLRGDILMDAGLVAPSVTAYEAARALGDRLATSDAVRGLLDRGRDDEARALVKHAPDNDHARARLAVWQGDTDTPVADSELVSAWNELVDFTTLTPIARRGVSVIGSEGRALAMVDADVGRVSLTVVTEDVMAYGIRLPLPPKRTVPKAMTVDVRARLGFRLDISNAAGEHVAFTCGLEAPEGYRASSLGEGCGGATPMHINPSEILGGEVASIELMGMYSAYRIAIEASP